MGGQAPLGNFVLPPLGDFSPSKLNAAHCTCVPPPPPQMSFGLLLSPTSPDIFIRVNETLPDHTCGSHYMNTYLMHSRTASDKS